MRRWFFWYILPPGAREWAGKGAESLTDSEAFRLEFSTKSWHLGTQMYRFVWDAMSGTWVYDYRDDRALLAGSPAPRAYA